MKSIRRKVRKQKWKVIPKSKDNLEISQHNDMSSHALGPIVLGKKKIRTLANAQYHISQQFIMSGVQGLQVSDSPDIMCTRAQLLGDVLTNNRVDRDNWPDSPWNLVFNGHAGTAATPVFTTPPVAPFLSDKLCLQSASVNISCLSMKNVAQELTLYMLTPKHDTSQTPLNSWQTVMSNKSMGQPAPGVAQNTTTTTATAGVSNPNIYGENPFTHKEFRKQWKVLKKQVFILQPGDSRRYSTKIHWNRVIDQATLRNQRTSAYLANITVFPFVIVRAGMCGIHEFADVTFGSALEVVHANAKVGFLCNQHFTFGALPTARVSTNRTYIGEIVQKNLVSEGLGTINAVDTEVVVETV